MVRARRRVAAHTADAHPNARHPHRWHRPADRRRRSRHRHHDRRHPGRGGGRRPQRHRDAGPRGLATSPPGPAIRSSRSRPTSTRRPGQPFRTSSTSPSAPPEGSASAPTTTSISWSTPSAGSGRQEPRLTRPCADPHRRYARRPSQRPPGGGRNAHRQRAQPGRVALRRHRRPTTLTLTDPSSSGYLMAWPCGERPLASNVNHRWGHRGQQHPGDPVGGGGALRVLAEATDVLVDITGVWRPLRHVRVCTSGKIADISVHQTARLGPHAGARHRQLRQLRLQPRPVSGGAGGGAARLPPRRGHPGQMVALDPAPCWCHRSRAGPRTPGCPTSHRHLRRAGCPCWGCAWGTRRSASFRRSGGAGRPGHARQDVPHPPRRPGPVRGSARARWRPPATTR